MPPPTATHDDSKDKRYNIRGHVTPWSTDSPLKNCHAHNALPDRVSRYFHPTHATFSDDHGKQGAMTQLWSSPSRAHRKHRYLYRNPLTKNLHQQNNMWGKIARMRKFEYWNISWLVAQAFTWGSVVWVINGFAAFLPFCNSSFEKAPHSTGWTAFLGATIFAIGSVLGVWEVWNADLMAFESKKHPEADSDADIERGKEADSNSSTPTHTLKNGLKSRPRWVWFSTDPVYWHQLGWYGAFFQLLAASIFWISGFTAIPTIQDAIKDHTGLLDGIFWVPQVIGGTGFMISATFIMLEAQDVWWMPRPQSLGWQVGFWNFLGGVGFALSAIFGFYTASWGQYESALSTFWGGWAFLIGSVIQCGACTVAEQSVPDSSDTLWQKHMPSSSPLLL